MFLPKPVLSNDDIVVVQDGPHQSASLIWNAWSKDPIKAAVIRAILAFAGSGWKPCFTWDMGPGTPSKSVLRPRIGVHFTLLPLPRTSLQVTTHQPTAR